MIKCENLKKVYPVKKSKGYEALTEVDLEIKAGDFLSITGPSGCGKSTLLHILGFLDNPSGGKYFFQGKNVTSFNDRKRSMLRREKIGFIFQSFNLLPRFSASANIMLPMLYAGVEKSEALERSYKLLEDVGLKGKENNSALELSGGECQRVAMARAIANKPELIIADEPTGNLDSKTGKNVMALLKKLNGEGLTVIMVTHDNELAKIASKIIVMKDGRIEKTVGR
ncbi:MAG: ABC transporter ATP-binding protein [Elusimicrobiales bacterium]|nr:ABC transporter ATP-binding protein [Elusimicrobiales bacterium]